jgi:hypothetical protein
VASPALEVAQQRKQVSEDRSFSGQAALQSSYSDATSLEIDAVAVEQHDLADTKAVGIGDGEESPIA